MPELTTPCTGYPDSAKSTETAPPDPVPNSTPTLNGTLALAREYSESIIVTAIIFLFVITFVVQAYKIPTGSMEKNLLIGDHLLVNKFCLGQNAPALSKTLPSRQIRRGDVIVFKFPEKPLVAYVKRVIGLPQDEIEIVGRTVFVNGKALNEPYTQFLGGGSSDAHYGPLNVPEDNYFVLGDNRDNSQDSRYWGFVPRSLVLGRAFLVYWSYVTERDEYQKDSFGERFSHILDVVLHFITKTRWDRTLMIIR